MIKKWFNLAFLLVIIGLLIWILKGINFKDVYLLLKYANPYYIFLAVLVTFLSFVVWNFRWTYMFRDIVHGDFMFLLHVLFAGAFFNTVTPAAGIGGEPLRAHFLASRYKKTRIKMLGYVLGDKFFQLIVLAFFGIFSLLFVLFFVKISPTLRGVLAGILAFVLLLAGFVIYIILKKLKYNLGAIFKKLHFFNFIKDNFKKPKDFENYLNKKSAEVGKVFRKVVRNRNNLIIGLFLSAIFWLLEYLVAYFLFLAFGFQVNFFSVIVVVTLANLIGAVSLFPGGIGVVEISMTLLFSAMGIMAPMALLVSFLTRIIYYVFSLGIGSYSLLHVRKMTNGGKMGLF
jgi:hypothetical protein